VAVDLTVSFSVEVPVVVREVGVKDAVTPVGIPTTENATEFANPPAMVSVTVVDPLLPFAMEIDVALLTVNL
jgi:hypothetical protein